MTEKVEFDILSTESNYVIAQHPGRNFPGVLLQGDSLRCMLDEVEELEEELEGGNVESIKDVANSLRERLIGLLSHYENTLRSNDIEIPYVNPVSK